MTPNPKWKLITINLTNGSIIKQIIGQKMMYFLELILQLQIYKLRVMMGNL